MCIYDRSIVYGYKKYGTVREAGETVDDLNNILLNVSSQAKKKKSHNRVWLIVSQTEARVKLLVRQSLFIAARH